MIENPQTARSEPSGTLTGSPAGPSCYRLSVMSGLLEVSARLKSAHDLELLLKVLEANKGLFSNEGAAETVIKATKPADRSETDGFAKADRETKTSAKLDRLAKLME